MVLNLVEEWKFEIMTRKTLIAYFSATGNTAAVAKSMATATGSDIYEIRPSLPYTIEDLDWTDRNSRSSIESDDVSSRPSIGDPLEDISQYETVLLGFPIWWYVEPRIVDTFLDSHNIAGKIIVPFATSGGSGIDEAERSLKAGYPQARWGKGRLLNHDDAAAWARNTLAITYENDTQRTVCTGDR